MGVVLGWDESTNDREHSPAVLADERLGRGRVVGTQRGQ